MRNTAEGQVRLQKAKERLDTEMVEKLKKLTDKAQGRGREGGLLPNVQEKINHVKLGRVFFFVYSTSGFNDGYFCR